MFNDLISLFSGWYGDYVESIRDLLQTSETVITAVPLGDGTYYSDSVINTVNPAISCSQGT